MTATDDELAVLATQNGHAPQELAHQALTDLANAERLIQDHGAALHYVHPWGRWLHYQAGRWQEDTSGHTDQLATQTLRLMLQDATLIEDGKHRAARIKDIILAEKATRVRGMLELARSRPGIPTQPQDLDADLWAINTRNGTIDLRTCEPRAHSPHDLITKQAPVAYDPKAEAPRWSEFLTRILPDPETRQFLQRATGYSLLGGNPEQILLILYGSGANGKSTFLEITRELFGDYGQQAPPETFLAKHEGIPNDVARLRGARFVAAVEIGEGRRLNEPLIKRMTGGDTMTARFMRQEYFEFQPQFTPWLATNHKPEIRGTDEAIWRRIRLLPFTQTIPPAERDGHLKDKLRAELPGILNWALAGCAAYQADGLAEPAAVKAATAEYRADQDEIGGFIADCCTTGPGQTCLAKDLYATYREWTRANGTETATAQTIGRRLSERDFIRTTSRQGRGWAGIGMQSDQSSLEI